MTTTACHPTAMTDSTTIAGAWRVDADQSHAHFVAATLRGAVKVPGAFGSLSGSLVAGADGTTGTLEIDAASVDTGNRIRDHHLRGRDFFSVARYPRLHYELRALTRGAGDLVRLEGDLMVAGTRTALALAGTLRLRQEGCAEIACHTRVDRVALGLRGARMMVPREVELDVTVVLRAED
jgi:polyisoprenoid-binding protein YceI